MSTPIEICNFRKFGFCKFGKWCTKVHFESICEKTYCENIKSCEKRHPRKCYFFCAYGYCKFGDDCQFKHDFATIEPTPAKEGEKEENKALKEKLAILTLKHEKMEKDLDILLNNKAKEESSIKEIVKKETEAFKEQFIHILNDKTKIIHEQDKHIKELSIRIQELCCENINLKQTKTYACSQCDFEVDDKLDLNSHVKSNHEKNYDSESESDDEIEQIYFCESDGCNFKASWSDSLVLHYSENHNINTNWEQIESRFKTLLCDK